MLTPTLDPEACQWNLFDDDLVVRLSHRPYVSLAREQRLDIAPDAPPLNAAGPASARASSEHQRPADDKAPSAADLPSLFRGTMPGISTVQEIQKSLSLADVTISLTDGRAFSLDKVRVPHRATCFPRRRPSADAHPLSGHRSLA